MKQPIEFELNQIISNLSNVENLRRRTFGMMWNDLGWHTISLSPEHVFLMVFLSILSAVGLFLFLFGKISIKNIRIIKSHWIILFSLIVFLQIAMVGYVSLGGSGDARYTFIGISAIGILYSLGWYALLNKGKLRTLMFIPLIVLAIFNIELLMIIGENF